MYEAVYDRDAARRYGVAGMRFYWRQWLAYGVRYGFSLVPVAAFAWLVASFYSGAYSYAGLLTVCLFGLCVGLLIPILTLIRAWDKREADPNLGAVWQCEMTDEGWSYADGYGVRTFIPWKVMRLKFEHPDAWLIEYRGEQVWVIRDALRKAELEETFRALIGGKAAAESP